MPLNVSAPYLHYVRLVRRIQHRLATIVCNLPSRERVDLSWSRVTKVPKTHFADLLTSTTHVINCQDKLVKCMRCLSSMHKLNPNLQLWLNSPCLAVGSSCDRPVPLPYDIVHAGHASTHVSHSLYKYRGLIYCNKCGNRGELNKLRKLSRQCLPPTQYGLASLSALAIGKAPPHLTEWPE